MNDTTDMTFDYAAGLAVVVEFASPRRFIVAAGAVPTPATRH